MWRLLVLVVGVGVIACESAVAPAELPCTNAFFADSFRLVRGADTTPWIANRYVLPHRSADTFPIGPGQTLVIGTVPFNGRCLTLYDSMWFHAEQPKSVILP